MKPALCIPAAARSSAVETGTRSARIYGRLARSSGVRQSRPPGSRASSVWRERVRGIDDKMPYVKPMKGSAMSIHEAGFAVLLPEQLHWRDSKLMKIPFANLLEQLGNAVPMGGRLWRLPPFSANTWHRHVDSWELYFLLEGQGRIRVGEKTMTLPKYGSVLVAPRMLRQIFNDTAGEALWLIVGAPQETTNPGAEPALFYPQDPKSLPAELAGRIWPPS